MSSLGERLLDARDYQLINELGLNAKRRVSGLVTGEQRSPIQGGGIEFADYRAYRPGDDVRRIDWAVFLRLRRLLIKLCAEEKEITLMLMLDTSRSMRFGRPDKFQTTLRMAAILAGIALREGNRAGMVALGPHLLEIMRPERSRVPLQTVIGALTRLEPGEADPLTCVREFATRYGHRTMLVFLSDLLFAAWPQMLAGIAAGGGEVYVVQVLAPDELDPSYLGEATLVDAENLEEIPLYLGRSSIQEYRREMAGFLREVRQACRRRGLWHALVCSDWLIDHVFCEELSRGGPLC